MIPPITTVASGRCTSEPAPTLSAIGTKPSEATSAVIITGRSLVKAPSRTASNYRRYGQQHRARLSFVRHSRELGFTIEEIRSLLDLADHPERDCGEADRIATAHLAHFEAKISQLSALRD